MPLIRRFASQSKPEIEEEPAVVRPSGLHALEAPPVGLSALTEIAEVLVNEIRDAAPGVFLNRLAARIHRAPALTRKLGFPSGYADVDAIRGRIEAIFSEAAFVQSMPELLVRIRRVRL